MTMVRVVDVYLHYEFGLVLEKEQFTSVSVRMKTKVVNRIMLTLRCKVYHHVPSLD